MRGETVVLRALLNDILERASSPAYGHGARHLLRLREIAHDGPPLDPPPSHAAYEQRLRAVHPRKAAFWGRVAELQGRAP